MGKLYTLVCRHCGKEFTHNNKNKLYCSKECKENHGEEAVCLVCGKIFHKHHKRQNTCSHECHAILHKQQTSDWLQNKHKSKEGVEGYDFVTCKECGAHLNNFSDKHFAMHGMTREQYEAKHGKIEQYTAQKFIDEHFVGDVNPNSMANTDEQTRKERSPFSVEFYKARGMNESDRDEFNSNIERIRPTQLQYYLNKGYDEGSARKMQSERQRTVTLDRFIQRYGEEEGIRRYRLRNERWKKSIISSSHPVEILGHIFDSRYSKVSQDLFDRIHDKIAYLGVDEKYATHNGETCIINENNDSWYFIDYTIPDLMYAIEFNGVAFHPKFDSSKDEWDPIFDDRSASQLIKHDQEKASRIRNLGYTLRIVWEDDYYKHRDDIVNECVSEIISLYNSAHAINEPI